jgi:NTP pyrophosphatase (non-canonical NTP hydrolase)
VQKALLDPWVSSVDDAALSLLAHPPCPLDGDFSAVTAGCIGSVLSNTTTENGQLHHRHGAFSALRTCGNPVIPQFLALNPQAGLFLHRIWSGKFLRQCVTAARLVNTDSSYTMTSRRAPSGQIVLFPMPGTEAYPHTPPNEKVHAPAAAASLKNVQVVLSGSYRKDYEGLRRAYEHLKDLNCEVLSPSSVNAVNELDGFVYMLGEESEAPDVIESRHLDAIQRSQFMWLHAPSGYVGTSAALEVGFAHAIGVPIFSSEPLNDAILRGFVQVVASPGVVMDRIANHTLPVPRPALKAFQQYYRRVAIQRGYHSEGPKECLLLMVEEVGELAREIRKRERLVRHGGATGSSESRELADIFLYVVHMANVLDVDLSRVVQDKELVNLQRSLAK